MVLLKELIQEAEEKYGYRKGRTRHNPPKPVNTNTGFRRVTRVQRHNYKTNKTFRYGIQRNRKLTKFERASLLDLKKEVDRRGLPWEVFNELVARKTVADEGFEWSDFE